ncbi:MAG: polyhydroxyalkanoic acid synthase [Rubrivivax sp.]|nr:MAG: polyhydroxyalkanoic acid synthase [Rubrivivax sp.]
MADIKIQRPHALGLAKARVLAQEWMDDAANKLGLNCKLEPGDTEDTISFERMGVTGQMRVRADAFELEAKLGMMMAAFKPLVEAEIDRNLAQILAKAGGAGPTASA